MHLHATDFALMLQYFNIERIRATVKAVNLFVDTVNDLASENLQNFTYPESSRIAVTDRVEYTRSYAVSVYG